MNSRNVLQLSVLACKIKHATQAAQAIVDRGGAHFLLQSLARKFAGCVRRNAIGRDPKLVVTEPEMVIELLQSYNVLIPIRADLEGFVATRCVIESFPSLHGCDETLRKLRER